MGSRNGVILLVTLLLVFAGIFALVRLGDSGEEAGGESGLAAVSQPLDDSAGVDTELLAPAGDGRRTDAEPARSVVAPTVENPALASATEPSAPQIRGRVIDTLGVGIPGARIVAARPGFFPLDSSVDPPGEERWRAETDVEGWFTLQGPTPGTFRILVGCPGYAPFVRGDVPLPAGESVELEPITLSLGAILSGRVLDPRGHGVAGATLSREMESEGIWSFSGLRSKVATTAGDGSFRIDELSCGAWTIVVESEEFPDRTFQGVAESPGREYGALEFQLLPGDTIAGLVTGVPDEARGELELRAVRVAEGGAFGFGDQEARTAKVAADGGFVVRGLRFDTEYDLQVRERDEEGSPWFWGGGGSRSESVRAKAGDTGVLLVYQPEASIAFRVLDAKTRQPVTEYHVHAGIDWMQPLLGEDKKPLLHHPDGRDRYGDLRPNDEDDRVDFEVAATGYESYRRDGIELKPGEEMDLGEILLQPVPVMRVTVLGAETGAPVEGAVVVLEKEEEPVQGGMRRISMSIGGDEEDIVVHGDDSTRGTTDAEGVAILTSMPGEKCRLRVTADDFALFEKGGILLPAEKDAEERVKLLAGGEVLVRVLDANGEPLPGARVAHRDPAEFRDGKHFMSFGSNGKNVTDTEGQVLFRNLVTGEHSFRLEESGGGMAAFGGNGVFAISGMAGGDDGDPGWQKAAVAEGQTANITLVAPPRANLVGRVREAGVPLAGATLRLNKKKGDAGPAESSMGFLGFGGGQSVRTDGEGLYEFANLEAGTYTLSVDHPTRQMSDTLDVQAKEGENRFNVELVVSVLEGRITDQDDTPLAGVQVSARRAQEDGGRSVRTGVAIVMAGSGGGDVVRMSTGEDLGEETYTDADGRYRLRGVTPDVDLQVHASGQDVQSGDSEAVRVGPDRVKTGVDLQLKSAGRVRVEAKRTDGSAVAYARLEATYLGPTAEGEEVAPVPGFLQNGVAQLSGLRPGPWTVSIAKMGPGNDGGGDQEQDVEVIVGEEVSLTFTLD